MFQYAEPLHAIALWNPDFWLFYMISLEIAGVAMGLIFVMKIRHPRTD